MNVSAPLLHALPTEQHVAQDTNPAAVIRAAAVWRAHASSALSATHLFSNTNATTKHKNALGRWQLAVRDASCFESILDVDPS